MTTVSPSLVVGNWTTNSASDNAVALAKAIVGPAGDIGGVDLVLCPPFASWPDVCTATSGTSITLGAPTILYKGDTRELSGEQTVEMSMARRMHCNLWHQYYAWCADYTL